jgi:hypothetical protein
LLGQRCIFASPPGRFFCCQESTLDVALQGLVLLTLQREMGIVPAPPKGGIFDFYRAA